MEGRGEVTDADEHEEDLAFMQWLRTATTRELASQFHFAVDWQRVAIDRELQRRIKTGTGAQR